MDSDEKIIGKNYDIKIYFCFIKYKKILAIKLKFFILLIFIKTKYNLKNLILILNMKIIKNKLLLIKC